jgi:hypothetical protein
MSNATPTHDVPLKKVYRHQRAMIWVSWFACFVATACSLKNFDYLSQHEGAGGKGTGGTENGDSGGTAGAGGESDPTKGGSSGAGGKAQGGATSSPGGTTGPAGGALQTGGTAGAGGVTLNGSCPAYVGNGGSVVTPPSNDFDTEAFEWATVSQTAAPISIVTDATACSGTGYLKCDGSGRMQNWDGPAIEVLPYLLPNHKYVVTAAARFVPKDIPSAGTASMSFSQVVICGDSAVSPLYVHINEQPTTTNWARFRGNLITTLPNCTEVVSIGLYFETDAAAALSTIEIDNFQLIDVTP